MDYLTASFVKAAFVKELNSENQARRLAVNLVEENLGRHPQPQPVNSLAVKHFIIQGVPTGPANEYWSKDLIRIN